MTHYECGCLFVGVYLSKPRCWTSPITFLAIRVDVARHEGNLYSDAESKAKRPLPHSGAWPHTFLVCGETKDTHSDTVAPAGLFCPLNLTTRLLYFSIFSYIWCRVYFPSYKGFGLFFTSGIWKTKTNKPERERERELCLFCDYLRAKISW